MFLSLSLTSGDILSRNKKNVTEGYAKKPTIKIEFGHFLQGMNNDMT